MNDWTFLFWMALAVFIPAIIVHGTLGRKGGHQLFDKDNLSSEEVRQLPIAMLQKRTVWSLRGSAVSIIGLVVAMALYSIGCLTGLPINIWGISDDKLIVFAAGGVALLITLGPALYRKLRVG